MISTRSPNNESEGAVLEFSKNLIVLLRTISDFPLCGDRYYGVQQHETNQGKPACTYHPINNPSCPWFTIHDLVLYAGFISYANVASTVRQTYIPSTTSLLNSIFLTTLICEFRVKFLELL